MKFILKNGKEFDAISVNFNFGANGETQDAMTYNVTFGVSNHPTALIDEIVANFTPANISAVTVVDTIGGTENVTEFEFSELRNIAMNITNESKVITVTIK